MKKTLRSDSFVVQLMRISITQLLLLILGGSFALAHDGRAQELLHQPVSIQVHEQSLKKVFQLIEKQTAVKFLYRADLIQNSHPVTLSVTGKSLNEVLESILQPNQLTYNLSDRQIILSRISKVNVPRVQGALNTPTSELIDQVITGKVTDEKNVGLPGVSVVLRGSNRGATTDANGVYKLTVPDGDNVLITFSFVGYQSQEVTVGSRTTLNISMTPDVSALDEVVVIGYGAVRKKDLTGSVVQLKSEQLKEVPTANVLEAAQGKIAGADITRSSGQAGARVNISIRGNRSIGGNNSPLIIVDGIQYSNLEDINANDIETMDVLKDASSIAIYGSRGANGVILITTKKGKT
ncbi:MAG: SusC/RagA family TonB-linked outer membrane protein, partial [Cytophagaceae bacterium]